MPSAQKVTSVYQATSAQLNDHAHEHLDLYDDRAQHGAKKQKASEDSKAFREVLKRSLQRR